MLPRAPGPIVGTDRDERAIAAARGNAERAGVADDVELRRATMAAFEPPGPAGHIVTNPPYGVRVGERAKLRGLYARFGEIVRTRGARLACHHALAASASWSTRPACIRVPAAHVERRDQGRLVTGGIE